MLDQALVTGATQLLEELRLRGLKLVTAESCTGGLIAGYLTEVPGSSDVVERGFVTYSNDAKTQMIGVPAHLITSHGAVSERVARAMAEGALSTSLADVSVAVTGVAGPGGGSSEKPVGLVHLAALRRGGQTQHRECRFGDIGRGLIREKTILEAFALVRAAIQ